MRFGIDVAQQRMPWDELVSRVQFAEELGFDGAWGFDHFQPMYGEGPGETFEGMTTLAALAASTSRIRLGLLVTGMTYRHPAVFAAQAMTIDHASHGRLELSFGTPNSLREASARIDELAAEAGRDPSAITRAGSLSLDDVDTARKHADKWREAGFGYLVCGWPEAGRRQVERFAREVLPEFA